MTAASMMFENEETLKPGTFSSDDVRRSLSSASCIVARPMATAQASVVDGRVILPGGFAVAVPEEGRVLTVAMDRGYIVHVAVDAADGTAHITVDAPAEVEPPIDDASLARLAIESRENATGDDVVDKKEPAARAVRRAWSYRRTFERLAEPWPGDGGPVIPTRWVTLSYESRVHIPGIGTVDVDDDDGSAFTSADGRTLHVRRIEHGNGWSPAGCVEVLLEPAAPKKADPPKLRLKHSSKVIPL